MLKTMGKKKLFRFHKGGLDESMKTCVKVKNLRDIEQRVKIYYNEMGANIQSVEIESRPVDDSERLGDDWENTYYVIAHTKDAKFVAGMCNFYDDKSCAMYEWQKYIWYLIFSCYMIVCITLSIVIYVYDILGKLGKLIKDKYIFPVYDYLEKKCDLWD